MARTSLVLILAKYLPQGSVEDAARTDELAIKIRDHLRARLDGVPTLAVSPLQQALVSRRDVAMALGLSE